MIFSLKCHHHRKGINTLYITLLKLQTTAGGTIEIDKDQLSCLTWVQTIQYSTLS